MKNKLLKILLVTFLVCACLVPLSACKGGGVSLAPIEITEKMYRDYVYLDKEYDVMNIVENKDDSLKYEITELFYLDAKLERHDISFSGTKFTQTAPYDVYVTLKASKGNASVEAEFTIEVAFESNIISENFVNSWADEGVVRIFVANSDYLTNGSKFAIQVSYTGDRQTPGRAAEFGGIYKDSNDMTKTSWDNVVLTADVYNPNEYDLEMGLVFKKSNAIWTNDGSFDEKTYNFPQTLKAKDFTTVAWSFKSLNITSDIFSKEVNVSFKCRITNDYESTVTSPYSYSFYVNNLDLTDYSAERFPNLDTTFDAPVVMDNGASASFKDSYADGVVTRDTTIDTKYLHNGSEFAFKVKVNRPAEKAKDLIGIINKTENCSMTSWDNVVLTADVYNDTAFDLEMGILFVKNNQVWLNDGKIENSGFLNPITLTAGNWNKVAWSLKSFGITSDVFAEKVTIYILTRIKNTAGMTAPYVYDLALTNIDFVDYSAQKFPDLDTDEPVIVTMDNGASETFRDSSKDGVVERKLTTETKYLTNGSEFAFKVAVNQPNVNKANDMVGIIESAGDCSLTSWNNVVFTADVYNDTAFDLEMGILFVEGNDVWLNDGKIENVSFLKPVTLTANSWTKVAWSLKVLSISSDIFADGVDIQLKTRVKDKTGMTSPIVYNLAITNIDFTDYSEAKFPDINLYHGEKKVNGTAQNRPLTLGATDIATISFEYCVVEGNEVLVALRKDDGNNDTEKYGPFNFTATGESIDYAGVTVTSLGNGYNKVVINLDEINVGTDIVPNKNEINVISFQRWSDATYYFANIEVTYK